MTPLGHGLTGATFGVLAMPFSWGKWKKALLLGVFVLLANIPDLPVRGWGHEGFGNYLKSHSIFVNGGAVILLLALFAFWRAARLKAGGWAVIISGALAWLSHLLLDSFYAHNWWLSVMWPFEYRGFSLPLPWFDSIRGYPPPLDAHTFKVLGVEFLFYFPILLAAIFLRRFFEKRKAAKTGTRQPD